MRLLRAELAQLRKSNVEEELGSDDGSQDEDAPAANDPWSVSAVRCVRFHLLESAAAGVQDERAFAPGMAHQVFGETELLVGYRDPRIEQFYAAGSLYSFTRITFAERRAHSLPPDLWATLRHWHPDADVESERSWNAPSLEALLDHVATVERRWSPPGALVHQYEHSGERYEVYHSKFTSDAARAYHRRLRVFAIWFVDGARYLDDMDTKWDVFTLFRRGRADAPFVLSGYVTAYPFFAWDGKGGVPPHDCGPTLEQVVSRMRGDGLVAASDVIPPWYQRRFRISQVLLLPPQQRQGHGRRLLEFLYGWAAVQYAPLRDITVEDPSPQFVALRDSVDLQFVAAYADDPDAARAALIARHTCAGQIARVLMLLRWARAVRTGDAADQEAIRLETKRRLYKENAADIPDGEASDEVAERKRILAQLWDEEHQLFETALRKVK